MAFKNRTIFFLWGFSLAFMLFVAAMSYVLWRDGPPAGHSRLFMLSVFAVFWTAGLGLCAYAADQPAIYATLQADGDLRVAWRYPFSTVRKRYPRATVPRAQLVKSQDDEGDPYFHCRLLLPDGASIDIAQSHAREWCENECARFNAELTKTHAI